LRPLIGITTATVNDDGKLFNRVYAPNAHAVARAGGLPVYIPTGLDEDSLRALYERLDGVLLPGGSDVDPAYYHEAAHPALKAIDVKRDWTELTLARWVVEDDRPLFGICRGHQVINVALGGSLVQDIPSQVETTLVHDASDELPRSARIHDIEIAPDSRLASILGTSHVMVNSLHHQSVARPAPDVSVTAYAPDGVIEALELPERRFALSVQWHPEDLCADDVTMQGLFDAFVQAARERANR